LNAKQPAKNDQTVCQGSRNWSPEGGAEHMSNTKTNGGYMPQKDKSNSRVSVTEMKTTERGGVQKTRRRRGATPR